MEALIVQATFGRFLHCRGFDAFLDQHPGDLADGWLVRSHSSLN
jgi:hypothetical protein